MAAAVPTYPDWKAPAEDGAIVTWPAPRELLDHTIENQKRLSACDDVRVQNVPLAEVRRRTRAWLGHDDATPLIADGHQTELYHPGVWVKTVLANAAALKLGGSALHLAVDTDAPKHLNLKYPGSSEPITDDDQIGKVHWSGLLSGPTPAHLASLQQKLSATKYATDSMVEPFLASLRRQSIEQPNLATALTQACHEIDWELGLRHHAILASPMWESEGFLLFAHHVIAHAADFARAYNAALAVYRREQKVKSPSRPMPDLATFEESIELPFWIDELSTGGRTRPSTFVCDDCNGQFLVTLPNGEEFLFDRAADGFEAAAKLRDWLRRNQLRLSPRALTLTMFVRLFVADQFIHGIGGGHYDQVTDRIIASHFGITPPHFAVTTATMYLPEAAQRSRVCVPCVVTEGHRLKHSLLGDKKREYLDRIAAAPRCSPQRYQAFAEMHRAMSVAVRSTPTMATWQEKLRETRQREAEEAVLFDRELFYCLQPAQRLEQMIARYRESL
jgi:hypothetical protein